MDSISPKMRLEIERVAVESALRIAILGVLLYTCYAILKPFIALIVWGSILAVAFYPLNEKLSARFGGRQQLAAAVLTLSLLLALLIPTVLVSISSFEQGRELLLQIEQDGLHIPPPPESVRELPVLGERLYSIWSSATTNLSELVKKYQSELATAGTWLATKLGSSISGLLQFVFSIIVAGLLLATAESCSKGVTMVATRFLGERGESFVALAAGTIRSVAQGVVGIAFIQGFLAGIGMFAVGLPGAGIWAFLVMMLAIMQLPAFIVLLPAILYVFSVSSTWVAVLFAIWSTIAAGCDTFLKPLMLGRGLEVPMLVILLGAIGGMILAGIVGLFVGAVILALAHKLVAEWINSQTAI